MRILVCVAAVALMTAPAFADSPVKSANRAWSAYKCADLARRFGDVGEGSRLDAIGHTAGIALAAANAAGKLTQDDIAKVPLGVSWALGSGVDEFEVGKLAGYAGAAAGGALQLDGTADDLAAKAKEAFRQQNCEFLR